tara:strand:+ start:174 stop:683 length:510 start_codon:yes stop_codon:yes gene_type:complete
MSKSKKSVMKKINVKLIVSIVLSLLPFIIYGLMLSYLYELKKKSCDCAINDDMKLLRNLLLAWFINNGILLIMSFYNEPMANLLETILILGQVGIYIYMSIVFFRFNKKLNENDNCECSKDLKKTAFKYYLYLTYAIIGVTILLRSILYTILVENIKKSQSHQFVKINL